MTSLPIDHVSEADISAALADLDLCAENMARENYHFAGRVGWAVYVWFDERTPIYVGLQEPGRTKRYLEHWNGQSTKRKIVYFVERKKTLWPAFAASKLNETVACSLEQLLIARYGYREYGGTLFNVSPGRSGGCHARGEDTFHFKEPAARAAVSEIEAAEFLMRNRPLTCWHFAEAEGLVIEDDTPLRQLVIHDPRWSEKKRTQVALYAGVKTAGEFRAACARHKISGVDAHLLWDSCCQHPLGATIALGCQTKKCVFPNGCFDPAALRSGRSTHGANRRHAHAGRGAPDGGQFRQASGIAPAR
jgi:hypothetical protein